MTAGQEDAHTQLRKFGNAKGYIVVNPEVWQRKPEDRNWVPVVDHPKLEDFLRQSVEAYKIDRSRVPMLRGLANEGLPRGIC
jgi:hypothetical protein